MTLHVKQGGVWKPVNALFVKDAGTWKRVTRAFVKEGGVWKQFLQDEVIAYTTDGSESIVLTNYFASDIWANAIMRKRVVVPAGTNVNAANMTYAIATTFTAGGQAESFAGELILDIYGTVSGRGGAANSGVGGDVIMANFPGRAGQKLVINVKPGGIVRSGGGGGGRGGTGGNGSFNFVEGPFFSVNSYGFFMNNGLPGGGPIYWAGVHIANGQSSFSQGGWFYSVGAFQGIDGSNRYMYAIQREQSRSSTGGTGGNGGRGQGCDGAAASGSAGVAGGTGAGTGGTGGTGAGWGGTGNTGGTGGAGNVSGGTAGITGGLAGYYLNGSANVTFNNAGTVQGRIN